MTATLRTSPRQSSPRQSSPLPDATPPKPRFGPILAVKRPPHPEEPQDGQHLGRVGRQAPRRV